MPSITTIGAAAATGFGFGRYIPPVPEGPPVVGKPYRGGFFVGVIKIGGSDYNLIVSPRASGSITGRYYTSGTPFTVASSLNDGLANSNATNSGLWPAAAFARSLTIGGFTDWYIPSRDELELYYRNLKPSTANNNSAARSVFPPDSAAATGSNASAVPPTGGYGLQNPAQTSVVAFQYGGAEADLPNGATMWTSSTISSPSADTIYQRTQSMTDGTQSILQNNNTSAVARAFRKELIV